MKKEGKKSAAEKKAGARKVAFRAGLDDKRVRPSSRPEGDDGDEGEGEEEAEAAGEGGDAAAAAGGDDAGDGDGDAGGEAADYSLTFTEEDIGELPEELRKGARDQAARHAAVKAQVGEAFKRGHPVANFAALWASRDGVSKPAWLDELSVSDSEGEQAKKARLSGRAKRRASAAAAADRASAPAEDAGAAGAAEAAKAEGEAKPSDAKE